MRSLGLPPAAPWILQDFAPGTFDWNRRIPNAQYHLGLLRTDGTEKPAAETVRLAFAASERQGRRTILFAGPLWPWISGRTQATPVTGSLGP